MRRKDKEIKDKESIESIIKNSKVCRLGLAQGNIPYVVPLCFGYKDNCVYFHSFGEGKKIDMLKNNPRVCLEFDIGTELVESDKACDWDMKYKSAIAFGEASFIEDIDEKKDALNVLMKQYSDKAYEFPAPMLQHITVIKVQITELTGKKTE